MCVCVWLKDARGIAKKGRRGGFTTRGRRLSEGLELSVCALVLGTSERDISVERDIIMSESPRWWNADDEPKKNLRCISKHVDSS